MCFFNTLLWLENLKRDRRGHMIVGFTTTWAISACHHCSCEFESCSCEMYLKEHSVIFKVCQWLAAGRWFSPGTPVSSTNKTDRQDITRMLLKVSVNTLTLIQSEKSRTKLLNCLKHTVVAVGFLICLSFAVNMSRFCNINTVDLTQVFLFMFRMICYVLSILLSSHIFPIVLSGGV